MSLDLDLIMPSCSLCGAEERSVYHVNITHNLIELAANLGIYQRVWRPEENGIDRAGRLVDWIDPALRELLSNKKKYRKYEASNGWGTVEQFIGFLQELQEACLRYPQAEIRASR